MGRIVYVVIIAVVAFLVLETSANGKNGTLTCNKCTVGLVGYCMNAAEETCSTNTSICFSAKGTFPSISEFRGFNSQGCREADGCDATTNGTLLGGHYVIKSECCDTDKCNQLMSARARGAPSNSLSLTVVLGAAVVAAVRWF